MNKNIIKIGLIAAAALSIVAAIVITINSSEEDPTKGFDPKTQFEAEVLNLAKNRIQGKSYAEASRAFDEINSRIQTEKNITLADGQKKINEAEIKNCYKLIFDSYAPIFVRNAEKEFEKSSWNDGELASMNRRAEYLSSMGLASSGTSTSSAFAKVRKTVAEYNEAKHIASSAGSCASADAVNSIKSKVASYRHAPLTNNTSLMQELDAAESRAKQSFENNVVSQANHIASSYKSYNSESALESALARGYAALNSYTNAFGNTSGTNNARSALGAAKQNWLNWQVTIAHDSYDDEDDYEGYGEDDGYYDY